MQWEVMVALIIAIPVVLFPAAFMWYMNLGGILSAIKEARRKRVERKNEKALVTDDKQ